MCQQQSFIFLLQGPVGAFSKLALQFPTTHNSFVDFTFLKVDTKDLKTPS